MFNLYNALSLSRTAGEQYNCTSVCSHSCTVQSALTPQGLRVVHGFRHTSFMQASRLGQSPSTRHSGSGSGTEFILGPECFSGEEKLVVLVTRGGVNGGLTFVTKSVFFKASLIYIQVFRSPIPNFVLRIRLVIFPQ